MTQTLAITRPDDWHIHLRDGEHLVQTVTDCSRYLGRALVMPNLVPPVTTTIEAIAYYDRIKQHIPIDSHFAPMMTLYLTDSTTKNEIIKAKKTNRIIGCKLYPQGVTTNAEAGVDQIEALYPIFEEMAEQNLVLNIHGETSDSAADIFYRETLFIEQTLAPICKQFPQLRIVLEHISTKAAVEFVESHNANLAATITPHHLLFNRNDLLSGGIKPHYYCLPILKKQEDQKALINAAISGNPKFFMGTDSAPHAKNKKESACGCAGIYSAHASVEFYAHVFDKHDALDKLEAFTSHFGADFYQLPRNHNKITLIKQDWTVPSSLTYADNELIPLWAGQTLNWKVK